MGQFEYNEIITKAKDVFQHRQPLYGDSWKKRDSIAHYYNVENKLQRLNQLLLQNNTHEYENVEDTIINSINYLIFCCVTHRDKKKIEES